MDEELEKARELIRKAHRVLAERWFIEGPDGSFNDDEVIAVDEELSKYLDNLPAQANT